MNKYGLIGYPLSHSFSKKYFTEKFIAEGIKNSQYDLFPLTQIEDLPALLRANPSFVGLNVTIPYKEAVLPYLDKIDEAAAEISAVNTIKIVDGKLKGYNTDVYGFEVSLRSILPEKYTGEALILGTGGAAKAIEYVLRKMNIPFHYVSRTPKEGQLSYDAITPTILAQKTLIVNTTPLGMSPNIKSFPTLPYHSISDEHYLFDLVYNPAITAFLQQGLDRGAAIENGLQMLHLQAEKAWEIWMNNE